MLSLTDRIADFKEYRLSRLFEVQAPANMDLEKRKRNIRELEVLLYDCGFREHHHTQINVPEREGLYTVDPESPVHYHCRKYGADPVQGRCEIVLFEHVRQRLIKPDHDGQFHVSYIHFCAPLTTGEFLSDYYWLLKTADEIVEVTRKIDEGIFFLRGRYISRRDKMFEDRNRDIGLFKGLHEPRLSFDQEALEKALAV